MKETLRNFVKSALDKLFSPVLKRLAVIQEQTNKNSFLLAESRIEKIKSSPSLSLPDSEFRVFSQWGQDGIIQYLIDRVPMNRKVFVEFGVEDYMESNTRFLLMHDNWSGLVIDGNADKVEKINKHDLYWRYDLAAECNYITRENINGLIGGHFKGDIGLLSIDIDGNDYWVWEAIDVISPRIVVCEYNSLFGMNKMVTVPYKADFFRGAAHYSHLYFGASLPALCHLAKRKGYVFVGCNKAGNDAFFVRADVAQNVNPVSVEEGYVLANARESRDSSKRLTFKSGMERLPLIRDMDVFDIERECLVKLSHLESK